MNGYNLELLAFEFYFRGYDACHALGLRANTIENNLPIESKSVAGIANLIACNESNWHNFEVLFQEMTGLEPEFNDQLINEGVSVVEITGITNCDFPVVFNVGGMYF